MEGNYKYNNHNYSFKVLTTKDIMVIKEDDKPILYYDVDEFVDSWNGDFKELIEYLVDDNYANLIETRHFIYERWLELNEH